MFKCSLDISWMKALRGIATLILISAGESNRNCSGEVRGGDDCAVTLNDAITQVHCPTCVARYICFVRDQNDRVAVLVEVLEEGP